MKYDVTDHQFRKFQESGQVIFSEFLSEEQLETIRSLKGGRDHWRTNPEIKSIIGKKTIGFIVHQLTKEPQVRLLMTSIIDKGTVDLSHISFQGVIAGALFSFLDGAVTFFRPEKPVEIEEKSYLVVYGKGMTRYVINEMDPDAHLLKHMGYVFGDRLKVEDFPFIYH